MAHAVRQSMRGLFYDVHYILHLSVLLQCDKYQYNNNKVMQLLERHAENVISF